MSFIVDNIENLREKILAVSGGREVTLLPVTKTRAPEEINELLLSGIDAIGENRVQEWLKKRDRVDKKLRFHMIGQLQSNKVRAIIKEVMLIHSLDRASLAREIQRQAAEAGRIVDVLLQVNIACEQQKAGVPVDKLDELHALVSSLPNLRTRGLMTIAPLEEEPERTRPVFREARRLFERMRSAPDFDILSMGMSGDFAVAVEEGSTLVRIGTAVFANPA